MRAWKKYLFLNLGMLVGFLLAIFLVPGSTPFWLFSLIAGAYLVYMNYSLRRRLTDPGARLNRSADWSVTIIALLLLALDIALNYAR